MRLIGSLESKHLAERFAAYLTTQDISSQIEPQAGNWEVWIRDEDMIDQARDSLSKFKSDPDAADYRKAVDRAQQMAREDEKKRIQHQKNLVQMQQRWSSPIHKSAPVTVALIVVSVIVAFLTDFGDNATGSTFRALALASLTDAQAIDLVGLEGLEPFNTRLRLGSITGGELWRSITPIFIHHDWLHLFFNMFILFYFGRQIENRYGSFWLAVFVLVTAIPSNMSGAFAPENLDGLPIASEAGYWIIGLGGFSGVNYALFGYIWMKMVFDRDSGLYVSPLFIAILLFQLVLYMTPAFSQATGMNVANWAHGVGFVMGLMIGYFPKILSDTGVGTGVGRKPA